jgi:SAM-dependent methyltransferase
MSSCDCCGSGERVKLFEANGHQLVRCTDCSLHYVDPAPDKSGRRAEVHAGRYAGNRQVIDAERQLAAEAAQRAQFQRYLTLVQDFGLGSGRFLDVGCGCGYLLTLAQQDGYQVEGIELTADRQQMASAVTGAVIHAQPVEDAPLPAASYSVITMINVFSHLAEPQATFAEVERMLVPGGVAIIATGEIDGHVRREHLPEWTLGDELYFLGPGTLSRYASQAGLDLVHEERTWLPDALFTRERFKVSGRSRSRNLLKSMMLAPGLLPAARAVVKRRQPDNPIYSGVSVLRKTPGVAGAAG